MNQRDCLARSSKEEYVKGIVAQYVRTDFRKHSFAANKLPDTEQGFRLKLNRDS
jgi:hypothetical protein